MRTLLLAAIFSVTTACITTPSSETIRGDLGETGKLPLRPIASVVEPGLHVDHIIFTQGKLPLENFLLRFSRGELREAVRRIDLGSSGNTNSRLLHELMGLGLVPVFVKVRNDGNTPREFCGQEFFLAEGADRAPALPIENLPREIESLSPAAIAANVVNATTAVVVTVLVIVALAAAIDGHPQAFRIFEGFGSGSGGDGTGGGGRSRGGGQLVNDVTYTTYLDYRKFLLDRSVLQPGASVEGLVFFRMPPDRAPDARLLFEHGVCNSPGGKH